MVKPWILKGSQRRQTLEKEKKKKVNNHKKLVCPRLKKRPENVPTVFFFLDIFPNANGCEGRNQNCFIFFCTCLESRKTQEGPGTK